MQKAPQRLLRGFLEQFRDQAAIPRCVCGLRLQLGGRVRNWTNNTTRSYRAAIYDDFPARGTGRQNLKTPTRLTPGGFPGESGRIPHSDRKRGAPSRQNRRGRTSPPPFGCHPFLDALSRASASGDARPTDGTGTASAPPLGALYAPAGGRSSALPRSGTGENRSAIRKDGRA